MQVLVRDFLVRVNVCGVVLTEIQILCGYTWLKRLNVTWEVICNMHFALYAVVQTLPV